MPMQPRERVLTALDHREPDRVPIDLGTLPVTGICRGAYERLRAHMHLPPVETRIFDLVQQLAVVDDDVLDAFQVDFRRVKTNPPSRFALHIVDEGDSESFVDEWGTTRRRPKVGGYYFDAVQFPIQEPTLDALERYRGPDPDDPARYRGLREKARELREQTPYAIVGQCDLAGDGLAVGQHLRGYAEWLLDLAANLDFAEALLERVTQMAIRAFTHFLAEVGDLVDVVATYEDLGMQDRPMVSPAMYRRLIKPREARIIEAIKARTKAKVFFHSCGSVVQFIPDLIEIGVDILNPVQVSAAGMGDTAELKRRYGQHLVFWGGGCDSQAVLPRGTPEEVRRETERRIADLAPGGGFVFAPVHNIQDDVPPENALTLYRTALERGRYPIGSS